MTTDLWKLKIISLWNQGLYEKDIAKLFNVSRNTINSIKRGKIWSAIFDVGFWYLALTGGIAYLLTIVVALPPIVKTISFVVMIIGMVGIVLTGGREANSIGGKLGGGVYALYGISGYVGDFVSYSRLMALGLSGGFIAGAVNMMAGMVAGKGFIGIIL